MLGVFDANVGRQPRELEVPSVKRPDSIKTREDIRDYYLRRRTHEDTTFYYFPNGNFMALAQKDEDPPKPRSVIMMDDIFCIFSGTLDNCADLRQIYGLPRTATEAMVVFAVYQVLRDRATYPIDQVVKQFRGKYSFILFDSENSVVLLARDRNGGGELHWGTAADGSLVCCDDHKILTGVCGDYYAPFPRGCLFISAFGLVSYDHPLQVVKASEHRDGSGRLRAVVFQVDFHTRLLSLQCPGGGESWASASTEDRERVQR